MKLLNSLLSLALVIGVLVGFGTAQAEDAEISTTVQKAPSWILSYDYLNYGMAGTKSATTGIYGFGDATINMHLLGATWLASPNWTVVTLVPYMETTIKTTYEPSAANLTLEDKVSGLGDVRLMAISPLWNSGSHRLTYDVGGTLPTGSVDKYFSSTPSQRASYNMQTGSGTVDMIAGLAYSFAPRAAWVNSARAQGTSRLGRNHNDYSLGDELQGQLASKYQISKYFNLGGVFNYKARAAVSGRDGKYELYNNYTSQIDPAITGDGHQYYKGSQVNWDMNAVAKASWPMGRMNGAIEVGIPVVQEFHNRDNVDLKVHYWANVSLNTMF